jgi:hypothetical protein
VLPDSIIPNLIEIPKWQTRREAGTQSHGSHVDRQTAEDFLFQAVCVLLSTKEVQKQPLMSRVEKIAKGNNHLTEVNHV